MNQIMNDLPPDRLENVPPFSNSGVDVFGPFLINQGSSTRKSPSCRKYWGLLFTCLVSRAVHIEAIPALDIPTFKNALRRFICLRGPIKTLRSDQGTNFIGAFNQENNLRKEDFENEFRSEKFSWIFNPPYASHFRGVFERKIKSVRSIMNACTLLMGQRYINLDELLTLFAEASSIINNTPLSPISFSPDDPHPITPAKLLLLRGENVPQILYNPSNADMVSYGSMRWKRVQYLSTQFWVRWRREYIQEMTKRHKWRIPRISLKTGDVVLILDKTEPRNFWPIGCVRSTKLSTDGRVRSATIYVPSTGRLIDRPISYLILLESTSQDNTNP